MNTLSATMLAVAGGLFVYLALVFARDALAARRARARASENLTQRMGKW